MDQTRIQQAKTRMGIIGNSPQLTRAVGRALRVAPTNLSVVVTGESGAGKEFFPRIIHQYSPRKHETYIAVNCGAIPEGTIDSELFGHEKGAFTGAVSERRGYFEEANHGTIFLDEVAELPLTTQARLLRVLETGEYLRVGSSTVRKTDIRVVAATNVDLQAAVAEGRFREDLYYRLAQVVINVPPLRDRGNDILLLARKFATYFAQKMMVPVFSFSDKARERLLSYRWPGNVRQLKNVVEQIGLFEAGETVGPELLAHYLPESEMPEVPAVATQRHLPVSTRQDPSAHTYEREREMLFSLIFKMKKEIEDLRRDVDRLSGEGASELQATRALVGYPTDTANDFHKIRFSDTPKSSNEIVDATASTPSEKELIRLALERNMGRRKAAAADLNISERTLYRKIKEYGLE